MLLPHATLVVLVDSHDWRVLRNQGTEATPTLVKVDTPALAEAHHASGTAGARLAEATHATAVAEWLHRQVAGHHAEAIVLIAPPRVLGELRRHLSSQVQHAVVHELAKDLIGRHETDILAALRGTVH